MARGLTRLSLLLISSLLACGTERYAVEYDYDVEASFEGIETYAWLEERGSATGSEETDEILRDALAALLERRGLRPAKSGEPDVRVGLTFEMERKVQTRTIDAQYGYDEYRFDGLTRREVAVIDWVEGTLIVDIASSDGKRPIWRGWAQGAIREGMSNDQIRAEATEALRQVMEKFPPPAPRRR